MQFQQIRSATAIVTFGGVRFLIDPMLAPAGTYPIVPDTAVAGSGNPTCALPCPIEALFDVDAVIVTHLHFDHFDEWARKMLPRGLQLFAAGDADRGKLEAMGFEKVGVLHEDGVRFRGVTLYKTACDHGSGNLVTRTAYARIGETDQACGVVFEHQDEPGRFYLAGDTIFCDMVAGAMRRWRPAVVAVNAAGAQFPLGHLLIMNQYDVACLMEMFPGIPVIATHVEGVSHATVTRNGLRQFAQQRGLKHLLVPDDGQTLGAGELCAA